MIGGFSLASSYLGGQIILTEAAALTGAATVTVTATAVLTSEAAALIGTATLVLTTTSALTTAIRLTGAATVTVTAVSILTDVIPAAALTGIASLRVTATARFPAVKSASSKIDQALLAMLGADTALLSYMTDGVYWAGEVRHGAKRFVEVSLADSEDIWVFGHRAIENQLYLVKAVMLSTAGPKAIIVAAEARIHALLNGQILGIGSPLAVAGYTYMDMVREQRIRLSETDDLDRSIRWWHRGGYYRIQMALEMAA